MNYIYNNSNEKALRKTAYPCLISAQVSRCDNLLIIHELCKCMEGLTNYTGEQLPFLVDWGFLKTQSFKSHNSMLNSVFSICDTQGVQALKFLISDRFCQQAAEFEKASKLEKKSFKNCKL